MDAPAKRLVAKSLIETAWRNPGRTAISVQVLQEFQVNFVRGGHAPAEAAILLEDFTAWPVIDNTLTLFRLGVSLQARWQLSLWDAMILAAAKASGARELVTEDFSHGQDYGGVLAINPFREILKSLEAHLESVRTAKGPEAPDTIAAMTKLASAYGADGGGRKALELGEEALPLARRVLPAGDPATAAAIKALIPLYRLVDLEEEAAKLEEELKAPPVKP